VKNVASIQVIMIALRSYNLDESSEQFTEPDGTVKPPLSGTENQGAFAVRSAEEQHRC
jgi:hypothetical protein